MKFYLSVLLVLCTLVTFAQPAARITGGRDTSYSTKSDYVKSKKQYPQIKIVPDSVIKNLKEERNLVYATVGQHQLKIDAFVPKTGKNKPAVLIIHGGGWRSGDRSQHIPLAQHLAAEGFACFTVEYRLSTEALYPAAVHDLKAAVRWIRANAKKFKVDTNKVAALGFSAGGELAAFIGITSGMAKFEGNEGTKGVSSKIQAVIDIDGTLSFVSPDAWETQNTDKLNASTWWLGYPRTDNIALWEEASPLTHAENNNAPFLFLNSSVERMHAGRDVFKKIAGGKGIYVEVQEFTNSPHSFCLYEPWFAPTVQTIKRFLNKVFL